MYKTCTFTAAFRHDPGPLPPQDPLRHRRGELQCRGEVRRLQEAGGGGGRGRGLCGHAHREGGGERQRAARQQAADTARHPRAVALVRVGVDEVIKLQCALYHRLARDTTVIMVRPLSIHGDGV